MNLFIGEQKVFDASGQDDFGHDAAWDGPISVESTNTGAFTVEYEPTQFWVRVICVGPGNSTVIVHGFNMAGGVGPISGSVDMVGFYKATKIILTPRP